MDIQLSPDQQFVLDSLLDWHKSLPTPFITLGGYAGTGKTTLIAILRTKIAAINPKLRIAFCSYTGKAARVLRTKLKEQKTLLKGDSVSTIHSLIYSPVVNEAQDIVGWQRKEEVGCDLIIVDEASMVDQAIWLDLQSYKVPIIAVGDHGQLPPIGDQFNLMQKPMLLLEQIHRQLEGNPIIELSIQARTSGEILPGIYAPHVRKYLKSSEESGEMMQDLLASFNENTLLLCGYNHTRIKLNAQIRQNRELFSSEPVAGDRVICLRNNHAKGIFNGMQGTIQLIEDVDQTWYYAEIYMDGEADLYKGNIAKAQFNSTEGVNYRAGRKETVNGDLFDFGYALTVHKAQGSQAQRVILFEERFAKMDDAMWRKWLYTAVTRAEEELYIFG